MTGGPSRFIHQRRGLRKMIETGGVTALLFDAGTGKTAVVLDYVGLLALKAPPTVTSSGPVREARVLVICPLVAVDTWILQANTFMSPMVAYWAEALGGSIPQRAEALASRGGQPYRGTVPREIHPRALHQNHSVAWSTSREVQARRGPDALGSQPRVVMVVTNFDTFASRAKLPGGSTLMADVMLDAVKRFDPDLVVVDESHKIKGASTNTGRLIARIGRLVRRRVILTGTVMPHSPLDVFGQWQFLDPYAFGRMTPDGSLHKATYTGFRNRFAVMGGWMGKEAIGFKNLDEMQAIMARNAVVARRADVLELPLTADRIIPVTLSAAESQAYTDMKDQLATQLANGSLATVPNRLTQMLRLRQITAGHLPDDNGVVNVIGTSKVRAIRSVVNDTLADEQRIVVFGLFTVEIRMLAKLLAEEGTEVLVIAGETSQAERVRLRARFVSSDPHRMVMVAQIQTMSLAVNELVAANHAVFATMSQRRDDYEQARARLDRQGQTRPVTFWFAQAPGTVDEVILRSHRDRTDLETAMLQHIKDDTSTAVQRAMDAWRHTPPNQQRGNA